MSVPYTAITFAPVQGFIEKSRKLRDLFGASLILSHLSYRLLEEAKKTTTVISPAVSINLQKGLPNRILLKGAFSEIQVKDTLLSAWKQLLTESRIWVERKLPQYTYSWERDWTHWTNHCWEIFWGEGDSIEAAMKDLETRKLKRGWTAVNWIGESSSLTGTDAIAWYGLGSENRNPKDRQWSLEKKDIKTFYNDLARVLEDCPPNKEPEGKFLDLHERLSIPELVKRLVTRPDIAKIIGMDTLDKTFTDIYRIPDKNTPEIKGRWTGWFMGDGDQVGKHLIGLGKEKDGDQKLQEFSKAMSDWGKNFTIDPKLGRIVYAGGDDFLGVIYSDKDQEPIKPSAALKWLTELPKEWEKHKQKINLSVGFVWAGHSVPQRDILQHCREAEKRAKSSGRNRVTIRILFNSGQFIEWTCPWDYLEILKKYKDRDGKSNWSHIYNDLEELQSRHAIKSTTNSAQKFDYLDQEFILSFFDIYFPGEAQNLKEKIKEKEPKTNIDEIVGEKSDAHQRAKGITEWISNLINVGFQLSC